ncbi:unnamed protein product [Withania somnifera]
MNPTSSQSILNGVNISYVDTKISKVEQTLQSWNIPKEKFQSIYEIGNFGFIKSYNIKTCESTITINRSTETIRLLNFKDIQRYQKDYKFLHIGLVQVAVKPLFRLGLDTPICLLLRDNSRHPNFDDSLLGILQSNLANGPVYFNCYLNYLVALNDQNIMDTLTLNVKVKNLNSKVNTQEIAIIYGVYYRLIKTTLAPRARISSTKGVTMLMEANHEHGNTFVPENN